MVVHTEKSYAYTNTNPTGLFGAVYNTQFYGLVVTVLLFRAISYKVLVNLYQISSIAWGLLAPHTFLSFLGFFVWRHARTSSV